MAGHSAAPEVRISKIADRFLVFDAADVASIRRNHNICSVLPLELLPEEASVLVEHKVGRMVDETAIHLSSLQPTDTGSRAVYVALLKDRRGKARKLSAEEQTKKSAAEQARRPVPRATDTSRSASGSSSADGLEIRPLTVTLSTSCGLSGPVEHRDAVLRTRVGPLHRYLQSRGYFMTPGLRFGADYSVYPGDPLRYHAHFLATSYDLDGNIPMLDVVGSGRLGTSVKKGFLFGGCVPNPENPATELVRTFCVEWAGM
ncbi:putative tRNA-splicing endonuclease subunit tsp-4 [Colletotrichum orbiculare MAFF 240422]|uniref:tRNA-splicing endonuclease subunit Sen34 n=1 Tax=Colletotrichum orbiculare (strain 104-T / ATCC 96160 / CBS 514.97 / LARS 414 / MAFF 240422) TaxID=1213857 RepID=A0A484FIG1_COLOR|nr:putative tRNA-splicing endonuclease subunit tsp-4 [Colletotrichum orbiculare MAFF 240422]